jgi:hypothetical protein
MKMKNRYSIIITFFLGAFFLNSCNDILDQKPVSELSVANAFETQSDLDAGLQGVYNRLLYALGEGSNSFYNTSLNSDINPPRIASYGDFRAGSTYWRGNGTNYIEVFGGGDATNLAKGTVSTTNVLANWQTFYVPANMINTILDISEKITFSSQDSKDVLQGELYYLRALCYFNLLRNWGKVPIIKFAYTSTVQDFFPKQSEMVDVAAFVASDLAKAAPLLAKAPFSRVRATPGAVNALKAHLFAWKGRVLGGGSADLQIAADAAAAVISNTNYQLLTNYSDIFWKGYQSNESIFELYTKAGSLTSNMFTWAKEPVVTARQRGSVEFCPDDKAYMAANLTADKRVAVIKKDPRPADLVQEPYVYKFLGSSATGTNSNEADNVIIFRLADLILLRAECLNEIGQTSAAIPLLNQIRTRAGLPNTTAVFKADVSEAIFKERHWELFAEGSFWYDLVRFGKALTLPEINSADEIYLPVFQYEMDHNPNLVQNPFYK